MLDVSPEVTGWLGDFGVPIATMANASSSEGDQAARRQIITETKGLLADTEITVSNAHMLPNIVLDATVLRAIDHAFPTELTTVGLRAVAEGDPAGYARLRKGRRWSTAGRVATDNFIGLLEFDRHEQSVAGYDEEHGTLANVSRVWFSGAIVFGYMTHAFTSRQKIITASSHQVSAAVTADHKVDPRGGRSALLRGVTYTLAPHYHDGPRADYSGYGDAGAPLTDPNEGNAQNMLRIIRAVQAADVLERAYAVKELQRQSSPRVR